MIAGSGREVLRASEAAYPLAEHFERVRCAALLGQMPVDGGADEIRTGAQASGFGTLQELHRLRVDAYAQHDALCHTMCMT